jgi:glycosyltransferase involved in cell wall biosynthesis
VITGLPIGGAQAMLVKLLSRHDRRAFAPSVIALRAGGAVEPALRALGVPVWSPGMTRANAPLAFARLVRRIRAERPDLVQTWMYHADLLGGAAAAAAGVPVLWGIRQSNLRPGVGPPTTWLTMLACARLSTRVPERIVCGSESARRVHAELGYDAARMVVIPNGFDLEAFRPRPETRAAVRERLGIAAGTPLIGLVARFHPQKDHETFLTAAALLRAERPDARFVLCGEGADAGNPQLARRLAELGLAGSCHAIGPLESTEELTAALDVAGSTSSFGEGFSNAVGEAMASGVPCVVTDVGDSREIVGGTGRVVPPGDPPALARAWSALLALPPPERSALGEAARRRIARFDLASTAARFESLYRECAEAASAASAEAVSLPSSSARSM